jgi:hypothetical protein
MRLDYYKSQQVFTKNISAFSMNITYKQLFIVFKIAFKIKDLDVKLMLTTY